MIAIVTKPKVLCDTILVIKYHLSTDNTHIYFSSPGVETPIDDSTCNTSIQASDFHSGRGMSIASLSPKTI